MFTGIVKEIGRVKSIRRASGITKFDIACKKIHKDAKVSDSVSMNGVCLTVTAKKNTILSFEAVKATLEATNLKRLQTGSFVNLEDSLRLGDKLGGHFVLGHIDCEAKMRGIGKLRKNIQLKVAYPYRYKNVLVEKGSVAVDGISLTVQQVFSSFFSVSIIPFTWDATNLKYKKPGDWVNIEFDYLLKRGN